MRNLIGWQKSRLAEKEPKKETFAYPEMRFYQSSCKIWTEEERSMLEAVVAAHPTINDFQPTYKKYWQGFREQQPNFLEGRNNESLRSHWNDMNKSRGEKKKKLSPLEQEAEDLMDEIEYEEEINDLQALLVKKQLQLLHCNEDEMMDIIQQINIITSSINRIQQSPKRQKLIQIVQKESIPEFVTNSLKK